MSAVTPTAKQHITTTPGVCGGKPCVAGTRIRVQDIYVWHELDGRSPDEIVHDFPQLTLADVYAALAYLWDNRDAILTDIKHDEQIVEQLKLKHPTKVRSKLPRSDDADPVSS